MRQGIVLLTALLIGAGAAAADFDSPFTDREAALMNAVWPEIRAADSYDDIDWQDIGLARAPGDYEARRFMAEHWDALRRAADFRDIDWRDVRDERSSRSRSSFAADDRYGPFTREEARELSSVWPEIRKAAAFDDIDWSSVGLRSAPGDREARRIMATHWDMLREAESFADIDWSRVTRYAG